MGDFVGAGDTLIVLTPAGVRTLAPDALNAAAVAQAAATQAALTALAARVAALEAKPEEVAHFGASARLPNVAALGTFTVTLTGLAPAQAGDVLRAGEVVTVTVPAGLPAGVTMRAPPTVPADGTVVMSFTASVALSSAALLAWAITALR